MLRWLLSLNSMSIPCSRRALTRRRRQISRVQQAQRASKLAARTSSIQIGIPRAVPVRKAFAVSAELLFGTTGGCAGPSFKGVEGGEKAGSGGITAGSGAESGVAAAGGEGKDEEGRVGAEDKGMGGEVGGAEGGS